jgi:hypothetical protein
MGIKPEEMTTESMGYKFILVHKPKNCDSHPICKGNDHFSGQTANRIGGGLGGRGVHTLLGSEIRTEAEKEQELGPFEGWSRTEERFGLPTLSLVVMTNCRR